MATQKIHYQTGAEAPEIFGISAVSRLTGISTHALRVWERRYNVVEPGRTDSKRREYSRDDIRRLTLLKTLVDNGHAIRNVAPLSDEQLEQRVQDTSAADPTVSTPTGRFQSSRVAFVGSLSRDVLRDAADLAGEAITVVGEFSDVEELKSTVRENSVDLLIVELPNLFEEAVTEIQGLIQTLSCRRAVVIYQFANANVVEPLAKDIRNINAMRAPVNASELRLACLADIQPTKTAVKQAVPERTPIDGDIPERRFSDEKLAKIARFSSVVQCECPQHLANLLSSLAAFETYSAECENRNDEDAKLHAYLHQATAECRSEMEGALDYLMKAEGIDVPE